MQNDNVVDYSQTNEGEDHESSDEDINSLTRKIPIFIEGEDSFKTLRIKTTAINAHRKGEYSITPIGIAEKVRRMDSKESLPDELSTDGTPSPSPNASLTKKDKNARSKLFHTIFSPESNPDMEPSSDSKEEDEEEEELEKVEEEELEEEIEITNEPKKRKVKRVRFAPQVKINYTPTFYENERVTSFFMAQRFSRTCCFQIFVCTIMSSLFFITLLTFIVQFDGSCYFPPEISVLLILIYLTGIYLEYCCYIGSRCCCNFYRSRKTKQRKNGMINIMKNLEKKFFSNHERESLIRDLPNTFLDDDSDLDDYTTSSSATSSSHPTSPNNEEDRNRFPVPSHRKNKSGQISEEEEEEEEFNSDEITEEEETSTSENDENDENDEGSTITTSEEEEEGEEEEEEEEGENEGGESQEELEENEEGSSDGGNEYSTAGSNGDNDSEGVDPFEINDLVNPTTETDDTEEQYTSPQGGETDENDAFHDDKTSDLISEKEELSKKKKEKEKTFVDLEEEEEETKTETETETEDEEKNKNNKNDENEDKKIRNYRPTDSEKKIQKSAIDALKWSKLLKKDSFNRKTPASILRKINSSLKGEKRARFDVDPSEKKKSGQSSNNKKNNNNEEIEEIEGEGEDSDEEEEEEDSEDSEEESESESESENENKNKNKNKKKSPIKFKKKKISPNKSNSGDVSSEFSEGDDQEEEEEEDLSLKLIEKIDFHFGGVSEPYQYMTVLDHKKFLAEKRRKKMKKMKKMKNERDDGGIRERRMSQKEIIESTINEIKRGDSALEKIKDYKPQNIIKLLILRPIEALLLKYGCFDFYDFFISQNRALKCIWRAIKVFFKELCCCGCCCILPWLTILAFIVTLPALVPGVCVDGINFSFFLLSGFYVIISFGFHCITLGWILLSLR